MEKKGVDRCRDNDTKCDYRAGWMGYVACSANASSTRNNTAMRNKISIRTDQAVSPAIAHGKNIAVAAGDDAGWKLPAISGIRGLRTCVAEDQRSGKPRIQR